MNIPVRNWHSATSFETLRPMQYGRHVGDDPFKCIFLNENFRILNNFSWKHVPKGRIGIKAALIHIMACCQNDCPDYSRICLSLAWPWWVNWKATRLAARTAIDAKLGYQGPPLLTRVNLNPSMDTWSQVQENMGWNYLSIVKFQRLHCGAWKWISNFILHFTMDDVIR